MDPIEAENIKNSSLKRKEAWEQVQAYQAAVEAESSLEQTVPSGPMTGRKVKHIDTEESDKTGVGLTPEENAKQKHTGVETAKKIKFGMKQ